MLVQCHYRLRGWWRELQVNQALKGVVEDLVNEKFKDGELDESPLTLRDLERIKEAFVKILAGIFHTRIEYPDREERPDNDTEAKPENNTESRDED